MSELDNLLKDINKKYKETIGFKGLERKEFDKIPFSSPRLNYMTYGGIARNTITELSGEEGSGKTTTALDLLKNAQKLFSKKKKCVYVDIENTLDEKWARTLGVNIEDLILIRPQEQTAENLFDIIEAIIKTGEAGLVIVDSVAVMISEQAYDVSYSKKTYGGIASVLTRFVCKMVPLLKKYDSTIILINQVRQDLDNPYNKYKTPGGQALKHQLSLRLAFRQGKFIDNDNNELSNSCENPAGHLIQVSILKTKICRPDRKLGFYTLKYLTGIDWINDLIDVAMKYYIISQSGAWYYLLDDSGEPIDKFQGRIKLYNKLNSDNDFTNNIIELVNKNILKDD